MPAPRAPFQRRPRRHIDDAPAAAAMALTAARQHRKHDTRLLSSCAISAALPGLRHLARREAAGDVDRGPELQPVIDLRHHRLVGEIGDRDQRHLRVAAMGKALRLGFVHDRARCRSRPPPAACRPPRVPSAPVPPVTTRACRRKSIDQPLSPLDPRRQHLEFDPVRHLADPQLLVEHILADAVPPRQPHAMRVAVERIEIVREGLDVVRVGEEAFLDQPRADAAHDRRDFAQRIFRMILHRPGHRAVGADFRALHVRHRIGGEHGGARRQRLDLVEMHGRRVEHVELADIHRMLAAGFGEPDAAAEADLAAFRIFAHAAAGRRGDHLQAPAGAEQRGSGGERRAHQIDLPRHRRPAVIDVQRGAGDGDAVIARERLALGQRGARIARMAGVHDRARQQLAQQIRNSPGAPRFRRPRCARPASAANCLR